MFTLSTYYDQNFLLLYTSPDFFTTGNIIYYCVSYQGLRIRGEGGDLRSFKEECFAAIPAKIYGGVPSYFQWFLRPWLIVGGSQ